MRKTVVIVVCAAGAILVLGGSWPKARPTAASPVYEATVTDGRFDGGAVPDDGRSDSRAVNAAIRQVHARGGGRVVFPPGVYDVEGIVHLPHVELRGPRSAVLRDPAPVNRTPVLASTVAVASGSIGRGSSRLTVRDPRGIEVGTPVAVRGAGGKSDVQVARIAFDPGPDGSTLVLQSGAGFAYADEHLFVEDELIRYATRSGATLSGVGRGRFGSTAVLHPPGAEVRQAKVLYALVTAIRGRTVTLSVPAAVGVRRAPVFVGSRDLRVTGLTIDGGTRRGDPHVSVVPLTYGLARHVSIRDVHVRNGNHGGVTFERGTSDSQILDSEFVGNGALSQPPGGAAIWVVRGGRRNVIRGNRIGVPSAADDGTHYGIWVDDRSDAAKEWDASGTGNTILGNVIYIHRQSGGNAAISIDGGRDNRVIGNLVSGTRSSQPTHGIRIWSNQGPRPGRSVANIVEGNSVRRVGIGIQVCDGCVANAFVANQVTLWASRAIHDPHSRANVYRRNSCDGAPCP